MCIILFYYYSNEMVAVPFANEINGAWLCLLHELTSMEYVYYEHVELYK